MGDLRERVPGHSLIDELLHQWDVGAIHIDEKSNRVVIDDEAEGWYRGVIGERRVASLLDRLGSEWTVLHSVPVGTSTSDIDHVVIGPPGIFTINTKFSPGKGVWVAGRNMFVGGTKQPYVSNALFEARRASDLLTRASGLTVPVTGLIVFVDPARITHKAEVGAGDFEPPIVVVSASELLGVLDRRPEFSVEQIARILDAAVHPETWAPTPQQSSPGQHITREFEALEEAVGPQLALPRERGRAMRKPSGGPTSRTVSSPPRSRSGGRRKPRRSRAERFLAEVGLPAAVLIGIWMWLQSHR